MTRTAGTGMEPQLNTDDPCVAVSGCGYPLSHRLLLHARRDLEGRCEGWDRHLDQRWPVGVERLL
jgi:hypothetical protein